MKVNPNKHELAAILALVAPPKIQALEDRQKAQKVVEGFLLRTLRLNGLNVVPPLVIKPKDSPAPQTSPPP